MKLIKATFRSYLDLFDVPGARGFVLAGFIGRFPISMRALAAFLMVLATYGSYTLAGAISLVVALTNAVSAPFLGRLADRHPQSHVILPTLVVHASGIGGLILLAHWDAPIWTLFAAAAVFGVSALPLGSLVRARWAALLYSSQRVQTAYALEAFIDDVIYLSGPAIVTVLTAKLFPSAGLLVVLALVIIGWTALAMQRGTQPRPASRADIPKGRTISELGLRALLLVTFVLGAWLGSSNVAMVAFAREQGNPSMGGVLIGLMVLAGSVAGLFYGGITWTTTVVLRLLVITVILGAGSLPLLLADSLWQMALLALVAGVAITPMLVSMYSVLTNLVVKTAITEGFAWIACWITIGSSLGTAAAGYLVDRAGSRGAYLFVAFCGMMSPLVVVATRRLLAREPHVRQPEVGASPPSAETRHSAEHSMTQGEQSSDLPTHAVTIQYPQSGQMMSSSACPKEGKP